MPDASNFNTDGSFKWLNKNVSAPVPAIIVNQDSSNTITILYAANIKTDVAGQSFKILKDGIEVSNFEINEVTLNTLVGNTIIIYSADLEPVTLIFASTTEATNGDVRLTSILNGANVT